MTPDQDNSDNLRKDSRDVRTNSNCTKCTENKTDTFCLGDLYRFDNVPQPNTYCRVDLYHVDNVPLPNTYCLEDLYHVDKVPQPSPFRLQWY